MKFAWLTDVHLNFLEQQQRQEFYNEIKILDVDGVFITGDIAEAPSIVEILTELIIAVEKNVYFVLGNHDYYFGDIETVKTKIKIAASKNSKFNWMPGSEPVRLFGDIFLLGQDGWADGRYGDYINSRVVINDSRLIRDLFEQRILGRMQLLAKMQELADHDAYVLAEHLQLAINNNPRKIIILTHVPPYKESCMHEGEVSNDDWLPFFTSNAIGDTLTKFAAEYKNIEFLVLCGHTHSEAYYRHSSNLTVRAGFSEYYRPCISDIIEV